MGESKDDPLVIVRNDKTWVTAKRQIHEKLLAKDLTEVLLDVPTSENSSKDLRSKDEEQKTKARELLAKENKALGIIIAHLGDDDYEAMVEENTTAKALWKTLDEKYRGVAHGRLEEHALRYLSIKISDSDSLGDVLRKVREMSNIFDALNRLEKNRLEGIPRPKRSGDHAADDSQRIGDVGIRWKIGWILVKLPQIYRPLVDRWIDHPGGVDYNVKSLMTAIRTAHTMSRAGTTGATRTRDLLSLDSGAGRARAKTSGWCCRACQRKHDKSAECIEFKQRLARAKDSQDARELKALLFAVQLRDKVKAKAEAKEHSVADESEDMFQCCVVPIPRCLTTVPSITEDYSVTLDSACHPSIFKDAKYFENLKRLDNPPSLDVAFETGCKDGRNAVVATGTLKVTSPHGTIVLKDQCYAPGMSYNLLYESELDKAGYTTTRKDGVASVRTSTTDVVLLSFPEHHGLYSAWIEPIEPSKVVKNKIVRASNDVIILDCYNFHPKKHLLELQSSSYVKPRTTYNRGAGSFLSKTEDQLAKREQLWPRD